MTDTHPAEGRVTRALTAVERLANVQMNISLEEWCELSGAILAALTPPATEARVEIKPLEWNEYETEGAPDRWDAHSCMSSYYEIGVNLKGYIVSHDYENLSGAFETLDEAKAAAQTDYEQRIRSSLTRPEARDVG